MGKIVKSIKSWSI